MNLHLARTLAGRLAALRDRGRTGAGLLTPAAVREFARRLEDENKALEAFTVSMEEEFLELGALLRKITGLANDVKYRSGEIIRAAAGKAEDAAILFAFQLLKKAEDLVHASREQYGTVFQVFERMHLDLTRVARERSALMRTLSPLETTNTQFRIQACAFDETTRAQFFALADTIAGIVRDVQSAVGERFEELDRTGKATGELVGKLSALAAGQRTETERRLADTRAQLSALAEALSSSERGAQSISEAGRNIAGGVGKAIVALQCQDMARQKFKHIGAAIDEMLAHLLAGSGNRLSRTKEADYRHFLADAGRVQLGQLRAVFDQLEGAARQVAAGLAAVESESKSLAEEAIRSGGATLDGQIIEKAIESIHAVLGVIDNAVVSIKDVIELVVRLKSTFSDCTSQILGLALRLRMVALNAQIFAAHVDEGTALEVVARNTRLIADESMQQLDEISSRVTDLVDSVVDLQHRLADYSELAVIEQELLATEAGQSETKLRALERDLRTAIAAIGPIERELDETIQRAIQSIRFPAASAEAAERSGALFRQIAGLYAEQVSNSHEKVEDLKRNYTMAHEREVHDSAVRMPGNVEKAQPVGLFDTGPQPDPESPVAEDAEPSEGSEENEDKLADNVELF